MAGLYDEKILGLRQQREFARKIREQASQGVEAGSMVSGHYVPNYGGMVANAMRQIMSGYEEGNAQNQEEDLTRQKYQDIAKTMGSIGITPSENMLKQAGTPEESPSIGARLGALVRFQDQPKPTPAQPYSVNVNANPTPENQRVGILNLLDNAPEYAGNIMALQKLDIDKIKAAREEQYKNVPSGFLPGSVQGQIKPMDIPQSDGTLMPYDQFQIKQASAKEGIISPVESQNMALQRANFGISQQNLDIARERLKLAQQDAEDQNKPLDETTLKYAAGLAVNGLNTQLPRKAMLDVYKYASDHGITPEEQRAGQIGFKNEKDSEKAYGPSGVQGKALIALGTAGRHIETLNNLIEPLDNDPLHATNKLTQWFSQQTGNPVPATFDSAKRIVANEVMKTIVSTGGGVTEREDLQKDLDRANSPAQLKGVMNAWTELMKGKVVGLANEWKGSTGKPFDYDRWGLPEWNPDKKPASTEIDPIQAEINRRKSIK